MGLMDAMTALRKRLGRSIDEIAGDQPDSAAAPGLHEPTLPFSRAAQAAAGFPQELRSHDTDE